MHYDGVKCPLNHNKVNSKGCSTGIIIGAVFGIVVLVAVFGFGLIDFDMGKIQQQSSELKTQQTSFTNCVMVTFGTVNADITCDDSTFHLIRDLPLKANQVRDVSLSIINDGYTVEFDTALGIPIKYAMKNPNYDSAIYQQVVKNIFEITPDFEGEIDSLQDSVSGVPLMVENIIKETSDTVVIPDITIPELDVPEISLPTYESPPDYTLFELKQIALDDINRHRAEHGVGAITLGNAKAPQMYAEDLGEENCIHHVSDSGEGPMLRYKNNNDRMFLVSENIAGGYSTWDKKQSIEDANYDMMYDDAHANWGHRDNIIDPGHRSVSIGITFEYGEMVTVQDFEQSLPSGYEYHPSSFQRQPVDEKFCW